MTDLKVRRWTGAFGLGAIALVLFEYHPGWLVCGQALLAVPVT